MSVIESKDVVRRKKNLWLLPCFGHSNWMWGGIRVVCGGEIKLKKLIDIGIGIALSWSISNQTLQCEKGSE